MRTIRAVVAGVALLALSACGGGAIASAPATPMTAPPMPTVTALPDAGPAPTAAVAVAPSPTIAFTPTARPAPPTASATAQAPPSPATTSISQTTPVAGIEVPGRDAVVTVPVHLLAYVGSPDQPITATLRWRDGTTLRRTYPALQGADGRGLLVANLDWGPVPQPPSPPSQLAMLELSDSADTLVARQAVTVLSPDDPATQKVDLYWVAGDPADPIVQPMAAYFLRTPRVGTAALEALLWGPPWPTQIGYTSALPSPRDVLTYPGRAPDWGPRVTLRGLTIQDGVATADFSRELRAYGGGSLRVRLIREQITRTLEQFPAVREVHIAIEGQTAGVLEP
jgi:hypothetical protein